MNSHKIKILISTAKAKLKNEYEKTFRCSIDLTEELQAELHARYITGVDSRFAEQIENLEYLEEKLELAENKINTKKLSLRKMYIEDILQSGAISSEDSINKTASFLEKIDAVLNNTELTSQPDPTDDIYINLMHPLIINSSWDQYKNGHYRDAVLNSMLAIGDFLRMQSGLDLDGKQLVEQVFSINNPKIIISNLTTESGKNEQLGFMQIVSGAFQGIRNPNAHSLKNEPNDIRTIQYLVIASFIIHKIEEAKAIT